MIDNSSLIEEAEKLKAPSESAAKEYNSNMDKIIADINAYMKAQKNINALINNTDLAKMQINHSNHVRFMDSLFETYQPEVFINTILWVYKTYQKHGFSADYWKVLIKGFEKNLREVLSPNAYKEIIVYYLFIKKNHSNFLKLTDLDASKN